MEKIPALSELKKLNMEESLQLAEILRGKIIETVSQNGGHLASNLGVVEATIALHQTFDSPKDKIVFDVGHQCYAHKLLTGREEEFHTLRQYKGISGFTNRFESEHDVANEGHCGTSISVALGIAESNKLQGKDDFAIAVVGDGALTNGMIYEALNNCTNKDVNLIVLLNDNEMSISKNVGGLHRYLSKIRTSKKYFRLKHRTDRIFSKIPLIGKPLLRFFKWTKDKFKRMFVKNNLFEDLGLSYLGPVDGHDIRRLKLVLEEAKKKRGCCVVHMLTRKGKGYELAESFPEQYHSTGKFDVAQGSAASDKITYSDFAGDLMCKKAANDPTVCALTAAMCDGTGLTRFAQEYPERFFDVGIAEEHAVTFASGLALGGLKPVVFLYSTFAQRVYDQVFHDVALQKLPMTFMFDRAGVVPNDGITHQGIFDYALFTAIPNVRIYAPETYAEMEKAFDYSLTDSAISMIRYPKGVERSSATDEHMIFDEADWLSYTESVEEKEIVILTYGRLSALAEDVLKELKAERSIGMVKLLQIYPLNGEKLRVLLKNAKGVYVLEEMEKSGGVGEKVQAILSETSTHVRVHAIEGFVEHGALAPLYEELGFTLNQVKENILNAF